MSERTQDLRRILERRKGSRDEIETRLAETQQKIKESGRDLRRHQEAIEIVKMVGLNTQRQLQLHISDITSLALESVFDNPYKLKVVFVERRNKTECDLYFERNGQAVDPLSSSGYGSVDIASFALRVASWAMNIPHTRATIILDEPLKNLSEDHHELASQMIKEVSEKMGIQFIIVTHKSVLSKYADRVFNVKQSKQKIGNQTWDVSHVTTK